MISVGAEYEAYEALKIGAIPAIRASFLPYLWPNGVNADGDFDNCAFISPERIQANFQGFDYGDWLSPVITASLQIPSSPATITWTWNSPGFEIYVAYRTTNNLLDFDDFYWGWNLIFSGDVVQILKYYQLGVFMYGSRTWTAETPAAADDFTAWAEDTINADFRQGFAADQNVPGDLLTYIEGLELLGEFSVVRDIEQAGTLTMEAPKQFDDLVAGAHSGLLLNNRQGSFDESLAWTPAPLFSPNKSSFFLAGQSDWYGIKLKMELGWAKGASFSLNAAGTDYAPGELLTVVQSNASGMTLQVLTITGGGLTGPVGTAQVLAQGTGYSAATGLSTTSSGAGVGCKINLLSIENYTEFIPLFLGKITKWGPINRAVDATGQSQPNTVEVYAKDLIADLLNQKIALPDDDGTPKPLTYGEFVVKGTPVVGWTPLPPMKTALFEGDNFNELDRINSSGGGALSLITPGLTQDWAMRAEMSGANQEAWGSLTTGMPGEIFVSGNMRFNAAPASPANQNMTFLQLLAADDTPVWSLSIDYQSFIYEQSIGPSKFNIQGYIGLKLPFAIWTDGSNFRFWLLGNEILTYKGSSSPVCQILFGAMTGGVAENWTIDFDDIKVGTKYYDNAYQVFGGPFIDIGEVYIDNVAQPDSQTVGGFIQTLTRLPEYGMVQITSTDPDFKVSSDLTMRVIMDRGGVNAVEVITELLTLCGADEYIDMVSFAAALALVPDDMIHARFGDSQNLPNQQVGLQDYSSEGMTVADAIKEICSRCLYFFFIDAGQIKLIPYSGAAPASPDIALDGSNLYECLQNIDMDMLTDYVSVKYGRYDFNPSLFYNAGDATPEGTGAQLDMTFAAPVATENRDMAVAKADLLLKFLSAQERIDPVRLNLAGARLELLDQASVSDALLNDAADTYWITRKEIGLDPGARQTSLQLMRFLGE